MERERERELVPEAFACVACVTCVTTGRWGTAGDGGTVWWETRPLASVGPCGVSSLRVGVPVSVRKGVVPSACRFLASAQVAHPSPPALS
ncbi:hypothetical protein SAV14893_035290 [Streptomyces avermitilis]|uniref:Uncharacterized protein n=1 Tax=Streptomyces avermitilis TaxID=33903 RepID=A0A4D4LXC4_STRAX|nr:hypothetical protein SAV14893_035290 [Streptomyces avermitilis]